MSPYSIVRYPGGGYGVTDAHVCEIIVRRSFVRAVGTLIAIRAWDAYVRAFGRFYA